MPTAHFKDPVHSESKRTIAQKLFLMFVFNVLGVMVIIPILSFLALFQFHTTWKLLAKVYHKPLNLKDCKDESTLRKMWALPSGQIFLCRNALEYQHREGFCCRATQRCILKSIPSIRAEEIPEACSGPADAETYASTLDQIATDKIKSTVVTADGGYTAFMEALQKVNQPDKYRVSVNFLRPAIFGAPSPRWLPSSLLLGLGGGHHSPVIGFHKDSDTVLVFDVNHNYGPILVSSRQLFDAVDTFDPLSGAHRALTVTEILRAKE